MDKEKKLKKLSLEKFQPLEKNELRKIVGSTNWCPTSNTYNTYVMAPSGDTTTIGDTINDCHYV